MTGGFDVVKTYSAVILFSVWFSSPLYAGEFYIDPVNGSEANDGSFNKPWKSLKDLLQKGLIQSQQWASLPYKKGRSRLVPKNAGSPIKQGDTVWLRSGDYGDVLIQDYYNNDFITIAAQEGHKPQFRSLTLRSSANWIIKGLDINPEFGQGKKPRDLLYIQSHNWRGPISNIIVEGNTLRSAESVKGWTRKDWNTRVSNGIRAEGQKITIRNNKITNVNFGIQVWAHHALVDNNQVINFSGDGIRGLGNYGVYQYNLVKNSYAVNANHDDGFQSWSVGENGVGTGEVIGVVLRGNTIINFEDPNQPFRGQLQGIGGFDGMYVDWVIENNVIMVNDWHGISLSGAIRCRIVNNTVVDLEYGKPGPAWIMVSGHKNSTQSEGCVIRNNITSALKIKGKRGMEVDHNYVEKAPNWMFNDFFGHDLSLKANSPAIDAGNQQLAPKIDVTKNRRPQGHNIDIGAYEFIP